jgi:hypothetical protein
MPALPQHLSVDDVAPPFAEQLSRRCHIIIFFAAAALVISRRPDAIFNAQFFAEDGSIWFRDAYMFGWLSSLWHPRGGYFQTAPRLAAALALLVPFGFAPLLENVLAIAIQVLPVNILLSERCRAWGPLSLRAAMAGLYVALPNSSEVHASMGNAQWHLALIACMLVLSSVPKTRGWRIFDALALGIAGLSGPFVVFLVPLSAIFLWLRRERWRLAQFSIVTLCAAIQASALLRTSTANRPNIDLGATPDLFLRIVSRDIYLGALLGANAMPHAAQVLLVIVAMLGTVLVAWCLLNGSLEWKLFVAFCLLTFVAALLDPSVPAPQWLLLDLTPGIRYWFLPTLAFAWVLVWAARAGLPGRVKVIPAILLVLMCVGVVRDWKYRPFIDYHFRDYVRWFRMAPAGTVVTIPINPGGWKMQLVKKGKR